MVQTAGFWSDLSAIKFNDDTNETWIQAMTLGEYDHPIYGKISITPERIKRFAENVNNNVRTQQLDIDYDHKAKTNEAAGWVKAAEARSNGLYLLVEWTAKAAQKIKEKAYKYFSPEFVDEWTHPQGGTFKDVLFGGGITNRPFLKDILPINMSEIFANAGTQSPTNQEGKNMTPEQIKSLAEKLGIDPASSADDVHKKLMEHLAEEEKNKKSGTAPISPDATALSEVLKKLSESNPEVKALTDLVENQGTMLAEVTKQLKEKDIEATVKGLSDTFAKKGVLIPPATLTTLTKALSESSSKELSDSIVATFTNMAELGVLKLGEQGHGRNGEKDDSNVAARYLAEVKKLQVEDKSLTFANAALQLSAINPELFAEYRESTYIDV